MYRRLAIALVGLVALLPVACGGGSSASSTPLTAQEYIAATCNIQNISDGATWGKARSEMRDAIAKVENVNPPVELKEYHKAKIAAMKAAEKVFSSKPSSTEANLFELIGDPAVVATALVAVGIEEDLSSDLREQLEAGDCD